MADEVLSDGIGQLFKRAGCACLTAPSGPSALDLLRGGGFDLILVDLALPDQSGEDLLERQRQIGWPVPCMALIRPGQERLGLELMREGALDCLVNDGELFVRLLPAVKRGLGQLERQRQQAAVQEALRRSELQHRVMFELAPVGMMEGDPTTGRFLRVNEKFCRITGYSAQELQSRCFSDITHPEEREADWQAFQRAVRGETRDYCSEKRYLRKDGSAVWVRVNVFILRDADGRPERSVGVAEDITERRQAEIALREREAQLAFAQRAGQVAVWSYDFTNDVSSVTDEWRELMGLPEGTSVKSFQEFLALVHPEDRSRIQSVHQRTIVTGSNEGVEFRMLQPDGSERWMLSRSRRGSPAGSKGDRLMGVIIDITEQKQAEEALRASEARYRALVHATSAAVWRLTPDGERQLSLEGGFVCGHTEPEQQPGDWLSRIHPEDRARTGDAWRQAVASRRLYEIEHRVIASDGTYRHLLGRGVPVRNASGDVLEWIGASVDVTEQKRAEEALRESEERYRRVSESGLINICFFRSDGRITDANDAWLRLMRVTRQELAAGLVRWDELTAPEWLARTRQAVVEFEATGHALPYEKEYVRRDGSRFWGLVGGAKLEGRPDGVAFVLDITERKRAEEALRASEERLRFAAEAAAFGWYDLDLVTDQGYRSPEYKALFGLGPHDEFPLDADRLPVFVHPDDRALVRKGHSESRDPQGSGIKDLEYRVLLRDGTVRWLLVRGRTFFEGEGKSRRPVRSRGIALDVTERKQLEQEILEISGREQRRIGHDLHDDLCQRLGGLQLLSGVLAKELAGRCPSHGQQAERILAQVREALERARLLARGLAPVAVEEGGLVAALKDLTDNAAQLFHIRCEFRAEGLVGLADTGAATHLYRIAQEAITNAVKHGGARQVIVELGDAGDSFELQIVDDGCGFTRPAAATAGMGMRIMRYRAAILGAILEVRSATGGQGTRVTCAFGKHLCSAARSIRQRQSL